MIKNKKIIQACMCLIIATILALTSHIYISEWIKPVLALMTQGLHSPPLYSHGIISAAYGTAFITVALKFFLYYHTQHLLRIKSNFFKVLIVTCVYIELNGNLIQLPLMDILVNYTTGMEKLQPFLFVIVNMADQWVAAFLIILSLVYLYSQKYKKTREEGEQLI